MKPKTLEYFKSLLVEQDRLENEKSKIAEKIKKEFNVFANSCQLRKETYVYYTGENTGDVDKLCTKPKKLKDFKDHRNFNKEYIDDETGKKVEEWICSCEFDNCPLEEIRKARGE